jgi:mono/diheme cytochrome c family protein
MRRFSMVIAFGALAALSATAFAQFATGYSWKTGADLYTHACQACHMSDGKGAVGAGAYPALAGNKKLAAPLYPVLVMLQGQKAMPSFSDLTDEQVAAVANYIRTNLGNAYPGTVTVEQVKALRAQRLMDRLRAPG